MLHDKTAVVTGGTDGIGKEIARGLARQGVRIFIVGSKAEKGALAQDELRLQAGGASVEFIQADLSLMREVDRLAAEIRSRVGQIDYLVLGAGIIQGRRIITEEGIESNFAVNYLSRFELARQLAPALAEHARIVILSGAAKNGKIHYDDINLAKGFGIVKLVSQFCEANDVLTVELARRLPGDATVTTLKIGVVKTNIRATFPTWMKVLVPILFDPLLGLRPEKVAAAALDLLLDPKFADHSGALFQMIRKFKPIETPKRAADLVEGSRLWNFSEDLVANALAVDKRNSAVS